jgi:hypothetical protein
MAIPLEFAEFTSLQRLARESGADIPPEHREQLARLGLIMDVLGVTRLTSIGMERLKATGHYHQ